jgi:adenylate cyclase
MGDGAICIFNSSTEAVKAGLSIQLEMLQDPPVPLRIGIHTGDVIIDTEDIYGDGVNIASRVESFAVPGGIFISGKVYNDIKKIFKPFPRESSPCSHTRTGFLFPALGR